MTGVRGRPSRRPRLIEGNWLPGLLPYVRLGKRCVVGLGFFGCAIGKLPEANGHRLDDIGDPNRPTSSVAELEESTQSLPPSHRPQAFKEE